MGIKEEPADLSSVPVPCRPCHHVRVGGKTSRTASRPARAESRRESDEQDPPNPPLPPQPSGRPSAALSPSTIHQKSNPRKRPSQAVDPSTRAQSGISPCPTRPENTPTVRKHTHSPSSRPVVVANPSPPLPPSCSISSHPSIHTTQRTQASVLFSPFPSRRFSGFHCIADAEHKLAHGYFSCPSKKETTKRQSEETPTASSSCMCRAHAVLPCRVGLSVAAQSDQGTQETRQQHRSCWPLPGQRRRQWNPR